MSWRSCFAWYGTKSQIKWLVWCGDQSSVGHRIRLFSGINHPTSVTPTTGTPSHIRGRWEKATVRISYYFRLLLFYLAIVIILLITYVTSWLSGVSAALVYSPWYSRRRLARLQKPLATVKPGWEGSRRPRDPCLDAQLMSTDFHSLHRYVYLMEQGHLRQHAALMEQDDEMGETLVQEECDGQSEVVPDGTGPKLPEAPQGVALRENQGERG